jgi:hypothetical protein
LFNYQWIRGLVAGIVLVAACPGLAWAASNVVFRIVVVNPSKEEVQTAAVKSYLPREVKGEDILQKGDLQVVYDAEQGSYFIAGEVELKPSEVWEQQVELRDVWFVPEAELASLKAETAKYVELVKGTEFADRVTFLCASINEKIDQVARVQKLEPANPEQRISGYRDNLKVLDEVRVQLVDVRALLAQTRPFSTGSVWVMILVIVIFLAILGGTFYVIWFRQLRAVQLPSDFEQASGGKGANGPVSRGDGERRPEKKVDQVLGE